MKMGGKCGSVRGCGWVFVLASLPLLAVAGPPGSVLPVSSHLPAARGSVSASHVAPDGSVILHGDFTAVDGWARPGLAVLQPSGHLNTRFQPEILGVSSRPQHLGLPFAFDLGGHPLAHGFLGLRDGTWIHSMTDHPLAYRPNGREDERYDFMRGDDDWAEPLFEHDGMLYFARRRPESPRLEAVRLATMEPMAMATPASWPAPFHQAVPAGSSHLWILGRDGSAYTPGLVLYTPDYWLFRVEADGRLDPDFEPVLLPAHYTYRIAPRACGGFRLVRYNSLRWWMWPGPSSARYAVDLYDADGELEITRWFDLPLMGGFTVEEEADGSLLHNTMETRADVPVSVLVRLRPDGTHDPDFSVLLGANTFHVLPDGRIHHSHIHRILPDGTPDPSWRIPRLTTSPDVQVIGMFDDGGIVVRITGGTADPGQPALMVLGPDRQPDPAFQPPADLPAVADYRITRDGRSLLLILRGIHEYPDGTRTRLLRLEHDGSLDPDSPRFLPASGHIFIHLDGQLQPVPHTGLFSVHPLADGGFLTEYMLHEPWNPTLRGSQVHRMRPDGSPDPDFISVFGRFWVSSLHVLSDERFLFGSKLYAADGAFVREIEFPGGGRPIANAPDGRVLVRYSDGAADQLALLDVESGPVHGFGTAFSADTRIYQVLPAGEGRWIVEGDLRTPAGDRALIRLLPDGRFDPTFRPPRTRRVLPRTVGLRYLVMDGERVPATLARRASEVRPSSLLHDTHRDELLTGGHFTHIGRWPRRGLAWLSLRRVRSFGEWLEWLRPGMPVPPPAEWDEPMQSAFRDYAFGADSDPSQTYPAWRSAPGGNLHFDHAINPDAGDVAYAVEVSENLATWRAPNEGELVVERQNGHLRIRFTAAAPSLFVRLKPVPDP